MYLLVFFAYDTIEMSNLLSLLGVGLLKLTQTLINRAQNFVYVCTLSCHLDAKIGIFCEMTKYGFTSINGDFIFARNAKSALVDNRLLEDAI